MPNTEWLAGNGLDLSDGVRCDADLRVAGADRVVACGDVARQVVAGPFDPLPTFWTDQLGVRLQGLGLPGLGVGDNRVLDDELGAAPVLGYHHERDLVDVVLLDRPEAAATYRSLL